VKYVNLNHLMPTRYLVSGEVDFKTLVSEEKANTQDREKRKEMIKTLRTTLADKYRSLPALKSTSDKSNHLRFFFKKLRF
jgi:large subunit ribosomal protein L27e